MNLIRLKAQLTEEEGRRHESYLDTEGKWTIGIGHYSATLGPGVIWNDAMIDATFEHDVAEKVAQVTAALPWFSKLNDARQGVLVGMCFQLGIGHAPNPAKGDLGAGLLAFQRTLGSVRDERWADAAGGMLASKWAKQTPERARRLAHQMATGEWQS